MNEIEKCEKYSNNFLILVFEFYERWNQFLLFLL